MSVSMKQAWWILSAVCVLVLAINIDYTSVNLALVSMAEDVESDLNIIQWVLSAYVLAWGAFVVIAGRLADIFGKRRILLWGVSVFTIASLLIGVAQSTEMLIAGRVLQGLGGALYVPCLYALTFASFPPEKQGFAIGLVGGAAGIGLAIGPSFSGFVLEYLSWRYIFLANIPLAVLTMGIILVATAKEPKRVSEDKIDYTGAALLGAALPLVICALNEVAESGLQAPLVVLIAVGFVLLAGFFSHLKKAKNPLIPLDLFRNSTYFKGCVLPYMSHQFTFSMVLVLMSLYLQNILGFSALDTGFIFMAMTLGFGFLSIYGGKLVDKAGLRLPAILGLSLVSLGALGMTFFGPATPMVLVAAVLLVLGVGFGLCLSPYNTAMMQVVPSSEVTLASSVFAMGCLMAHTLAVVASSGSITSIGLWEAQAGLTQLNLNPEQLHQVAVIMNSAHRPAELFAVFPEEMRATIKAIVDEGFMYAVHCLSFICAMLTALGSYVTYKCLNVESQVEDEQAAPASAA